MKIYNDNHNSNNDYVNNVNKLIPNIPYRKENIMKARKRPIEVLAVCYDNKYSTEEFLELLRQHSNEDMRYNENSKSIFITKERGEIELRINNWVIIEKDTDGEIWAIHHDIFAKTYEKVEGTDNQNTYRKKQYEVEYIEFDKVLNERNIANILTFIDITATTPLEILQRDDLIRDIIKEGKIRISTLEGIEDFYPTEVLIKGIAGEFYPVKREMFDKVYEVIE